CSPNSKLQTLNSTSFTLIHLNKKEKTMKKILTGLVLLSLAYCNDFDITGNKQREKEQKEKENNSNLIFIACYSEYTAGRMSYTAYTNCISASRISGQ
ncbi:MAG TPA: hypothetical protein PL048_18030, partial [Leptospiraceae bacterium]|nr:hypothetical protein [Leptospiraceae bacterium]